MNNELPKHILWGGPPMFLGFEANPETKSLDFWVATLKQMGHIALIRIGLCWPPLYIKRWTKTERESLME